MKIYKYFIKLNANICRRYCRKYSAERYFLNHKDRHSRGHFRIEDRLGNILMSNRLITAA